jgi:Haem-binding domain
MTVKKRLLLGFGVLLLLIQFVRLNRSAPEYDESLSMASNTELTPQVEAIFDRSCNDCHSEETVWPWYSEVAPISWLLIDHVKEGRDEFSTPAFGSYSPKRASRKLKEICEQVEAGEMPLRTYEWLHPKSALSDSDVEALCNWTKSEIDRIGPIPPDDSTGTDSEEDLDIVDDSLRP